MIRLMAINAGFTDFLLTKVAKSGRSLKMPMLKAAGSHVQQLKYSAPMKAVKAMTPPPPSAFIGI
jgi:hypothetical protein